MPYSNFLKGTNSFDADKLFGGYISHGYDTPSYVPKSVKDLEILGKSAFKKLQTRVFDDLAKKHCIQSRFSFL